MTEELLGHCPPFETRSAAEPFRALEGLAVLFNGGGTFLVEEAGDGEEQENPLSNDFFAGTVFGDGAAREIREGTGKGVCCRNLAGTVVPPGVPRPGGTGASRDPELLPDEALSVSEDTESSAASKEARLNPSSAAMERRRRWMAAMMGSSLSTEDKSRLLAS